MMRVRGIAKNQILKMRKRTGFVQAAKEKLCHKGKDRRLAGWGVGMGVVI